MPELDAVARRLPPEEFEKFSGEIKLMLDDSGKSPGDVAKVILARKRSMEQ
jgi:hypothetical protein